MLTFIYIHLYFLNKPNICGEDEVRSVQVVFVGIGLELIFDSFSVCVCQHSCFDLFSALPGQSQSGRNPSASSD